jgi:hypothetical protein
VRVVYSWAHLSAILDAIRRRPMGWNPTVATARSGNARSRPSRVFQFTFGFLLGVAWTTLAALRIVVLHTYVFILLLLLGACVTFVNARVAFHIERKQ